MSSSTLRWDELSADESWAVARLRLRLGKQHSLVVGQRQSSERRECMRQRIAERALSYEGPESFASWIESRQKVVAEIRREIDEELAHFDRAAALSAQEQERLCGLAFDLLDVLGRAAELRGVARHACGEHEV